MFRLLLLLAASIAFAADFIVVNANVITVDTRLPYAEAFAVENGRFSAVGSNADIRRLGTPQTKIVDARGKSILPGFNDAHLHPHAVFEEDSLYYNPWLGPYKVHNMDELIAALRRKALRTPAGQPVRGSGYHDLELGRHPTRYDLDKASTTHPITITHTSGHLVAVNSYVLKAAGITKETPDPSGGSFDRDSDGTPNGVVREAARRLLARNGAEGTPLTVPFEAEVQGYLRCFREYAARGMTSCAAAGAGPEAIRIYQAVRAAGNPVRLGVMVAENSFQTAANLGLRSGFGDDRLRLTAIKVFHGASLSGRTCWVSEEYPERPGYFGIPPAR